MKTALAISGGGSNGAFSVGAVETLVKEYGEVFNLVAGTSTGALIGPLVALNDVDKAVDIYSSVSNSDVLRLNWRRFFIDGIYDTSPLEKLIRDYMTPSRYKKLMTAAAEVLLCQISLQSSRKTYFSQRAAIPGTSAWENVDEFVGAVLGSANQPVFMRPSSFRGHQFVDGGIREVIPLEICLQAGMERIIVVASSPEEKPSNSKKEYNTVLHIGPRALGIMVREVSNGDIRYIKDMYEIKKEYGIDLSRWIAHLPKELIIIRPPHSLGDGLNFNPKRMSEWMQLGRQVAREIMYGR